MGNISATQLVILLIIVLLVFGTRRLRNIGSDLGGAIKGFRKGMHENDDDSSEDIKAQLRDDASNADSGDQVNTGEQQKNHS
ncbi:MAG: twin-arginine translocase TatA/TatE family subunit [Gammaproteobacteria bacterium]|jgi:sec-independent protein translocase protein TatA|nr:twin-arginine translocase TatA/TatE family subunit [Gammaproteobacteria bacterium]